MCAAIVLSSCGQPPPGPKPAEIPPAEGVSVASRDTTAIQPWDGADDALPPAATDSTQHLLGADTLVFSQVQVFPAYAVRPDQVAPGQPTTGPMRLHVRVLARDTSQSMLRERPLALAACPVVLRLYRDLHRKEPPVWRSDAARDPCPAITRYGSAADINVGWSAPEMLADSLPAGQYAFSHTVRLADGRVLEFAAGSAYLSADPEPATRDLRAVRMSAQSEIVGQAPRMLRTTVTLRNTGTRPVRFEHGACTPRLRLFRTAARTGAPVWRSEFRAPPPPPGSRGRPGGYACPAVLIQRELPPGDTAVFAPMIPLYQVLADSLPAGQYRVLAELELLNDELPVSRWATLYRLEAGTVELARRPDPLPASRTIGAIRYEASSQRVNGAGGADTVRTRVRVVNVGRERAFAEVPRDCPVQVYGFRTRAARDSVPIGTPIWRSPHSCVLYQHRFALDPGQAWTFRHDAPVREIAAEAGTGPLFFTAWIGGHPHVQLAAGEITLAPDRN